MELWKNESKEIDERQRWDYTCGEEMSQKNRHLRLCYKTIGTRNVDEDGDGKLEEENRS